MPIVGSALTTSIRAAGANMSLGADWLRLSSAVGSAVAVWSKIQTNVLMIGATTGAAGAGPVTGKFFMVPSPVPLIGSFAASGLVGVDGPQLARAIGTGIGTYYNLAAGYRGQATGAIGADVSKVTFANGAALRALLQARLAGAGIRGVDSVALAGAISTGVALMFATGGGTGVAAGAGGPAPSAGVSRSGLF